jgi:probable HAF family extracellular repeat protein
LVGQVAPQALPDKKIGFLINESGKGCHEARCAPTLAYNYLDYSRGIISTQKLLIEERTLKKVLFISIYLFLTISYLHATEKYVMVDLHVPGYEESRVSSINNFGAVVGNIFDPNYYAFKWENGQTTILPLPAPLPQYPDSQFIESYAAAINDNGDIGGHVATNEYSTSCIWHMSVASAIPETITDSATMPIQMNDLNNPLQAVLHWRGYLTFLWDNGSFETILEDFEDNFEYSFPYAINDLGQIVGSMNNYDGYYFPYLWENGQLFDLNELVTEEPIGTLWYATDINNFSQIVGRISDYPYESSFLFDQGQITDLGFKGARAINDSGHVIGLNFLYKNGQVFNLYDLIETNIAYTSFEAIDINNAGQIIGNASIDGLTHAVLLDPAGFAIWNEFDYLAFISRKTDLDKDGDNDGSDIAIFLAAYGSNGGDAGYNIDADFDKDNDVDQIDLGIFSRVFGCTDLPIILPNIPVLDQNDYTNPERVETYVESVANIEAGGCVPVSFAMLFLGHYREFGPSFPIIDLSNSSENTKKLMDDITQKISIPIPQNEWQIFKFWTNEQTKINAPQILAYMDNYSFDFENTDYIVEAAWDIDYECSTAVSNDQLIRKVIERLNNNEPIFFIGHISINDVNESGGHVSIISGYAKLDGIEYFRVNDTYSNISAPWYRVERGDACVVNQNCSPNYCPIKLVREDKDWVFEIESYIAWPQTLVFTVLPKF